MKALGKRYTPEIHVELEISKIFDGISRDEHFEKQITNLLDTLLIRYGKIYNKNEGEEKLLRVLEENIIEFRKLFDSNSFQGISTIDYSIFLESIKNISEASDKLYEFYTTIQNNNEGEKHSNKFGNEINRLNEFDSSLNALKSFFLSKTAKLSNLPILLIEGEAGIGKSHLLADKVVKRTQGGKGSLLLLGQHFVTEGDPWVQLSNKLQLKCNKQEFLGALNAKAQVSGNRFIIFIDAINEGKGRYFWGDNLAPFIHLISQYEWLGLVLSIRSSYVDLIAPREQGLDENLVRYIHRGFLDIEYEASKLFFDNFGIELPSVPLLHPEFQNPLFLKLFCEGLHKAGYTRVPGGFQGISAIIDFFINSSNDKLQKPSELDYPKNINIVKRAIEALMKEKLENNRQYIEYEKAYGICEIILKDFSSKRNLVDALISEGVLSKNIFYVQQGKHEEGVYLAYERFEDHASVSYLLNRDIDLETEFSKEGSLFQFIKDDSSCYTNRGIIDALSIQLPEKYSRELYEFTNHLGNGGKYVIAESFVESLLWRKIETMHDGLHDYINEVVLSFQGTGDQFWDTMVAVSAIPNHQFNALSLHKNLFNRSMADRDSWWSSSYLSRQMEWSGSVKRLVEWSWSIEDRKYISDDSILLASIALTWFLCSPDRVLRDSSTKALVCLLKNRLYLVVELLKKFEGINDPYIYDRLFAASYGASLRTDDTKALPELCNYIFETIFNKKEVYPHILLRDYARSIIEYANHIGIKLDFDIVKARPPYQSVFPEEALTNEELDTRYKLDYDSKEYKDYHRSQNVILHSMTTEYGRGTGGYGDFGRYTFQSALRAWNINPNVLSNKAVEWVFEKYGYDVEKHGRFDNNIPWTGRRANGLERIGKKYQWLALYEILARVADNIPDFSDRGRYWDDEEESDRKYDGPWEPYIRDIDPTLLIKDTGSVNEDIPTDFWWINTAPIETELSDDQWISNEGDIPDAGEIISVKDNDGNEWLILEGYPEWAEKRQLGEEKYDVPHKRMWWQIRSYLVKEEDYKEFIEWTDQQNFWGRWMPESRDRYELFYRESYWSPGYKFFQQDYYDGIPWKKIRNQNYQEEEFEVMVTTDSYMWEKEFDFSKEQTIRIFKPTQHIYEKMNLFHSEKDGEFIDENGHLVCFDSSVYNNSKQFLLIKKEAFLKYLEQEKLRTVWTMIGEKQIIGGSLGRSHGRKFNLMELSGSFRLEAKAITGNVQTKLE
ncbi:ATP-binding protein [Flavobacterium arcticum]|uniref:ATP-binding protein n=1 Tax=Flavobacterium arcticum TaxID=1784713 RepID=A0A345HF36_9FLAO|nr:ATP-binding protein [Flavobacterium arcticum]KAF2510532.1 ATP-binding protein [Flavobacterium arcticum]